MREIMYALVGYGVTLLMLTWLLSHFVSWIFDFVRETWKRAF